MARLAKLDFEERSGKLVDADQVRAQIYGLGRRLRDTMLGLPDRLAPVLTGLTDQAAVHRILSETGVDMRPFPSGASSIAALPARRRSPSSQPDRSGFSSV